MLESLALSGALSTKEKGEQAAWDEFARIQDDKHWRGNTRFADALSEKHHNEHLMGDPSKAVAGYQMAGFSPLSALGQSMTMPVTTSGNAPSMPVSSPSHGGANPLEIAQLRLVDAQTKKQEIENARMINEDEGSAEAVKSFYEAKLRDNPNMSPEQRAYFESVLERPDSSFNVGDIRAQNNFREMVTKDVDMVANAIKKDYENYLWQAYKSGQMPYLEVSKNKHEIDKLIADIAQVEANTVLAIYNTALVPHQAEKLDAETKKAIAEANSIYNGDIVSLWKNKDYEALTVNAVREVLRGLGEYAKAKTFGKALKGSDKSSKASNDVVGSSVMDSAKSSAQSVAKTATSKASHSEPQQLKVARLHRELARMKNDGTKYFRPNVYQKKFDEYMRAKNGVE